MKDAMKRMKEEVTRARARKELPSRRRCADSTLRHFSHERSHDKTGAPKTVDSWLSLCLFALACAWLFRSCAHVYARI